jgi:hypothetical protein
MPSETTRRAEAVITAKIRHDAVTAGSRPSLGAATGEWGRIVALRVPPLSDLAFYNKARGVNEDDIPHLCTVSEFYTGVGIAPTLEVWADDASDGLGIALARHGLYAGAVTATLHRHLDGDPRLTGRADSPVTVEELMPTAAERLAHDNETDYMATLVGGYELAEGRAEHLAMLRAEHDPAVVRRYIAYVGGRPAAAASLYLAPDGALLGGAATPPAFRRHGCQAALISHRLADAAKLTDLAVVTTAFGSAGQTNLERSGFRLTHTRTAWRPLP